MDQQDHEPREETVNQHPHEDHPAPPPPAADAPDLSTISDAAATPPEVAERGFAPPPPPPLVHVVDLSTIHDAAVLPGPVEPARPTGFRPQPDFTPVIKG